MHPFDIVPGPAVADVLRDRRGVQEIVAEVYRAHGAALTTNPDSYFLRFEDRPDDRIIALPARLRTDGDDVAGIKWISSFPNNIHDGLPRASAVLILNDMVDGYPYACLEGAGISAARTAGSVALTRRLLETTHPSDGTVGVVGAGVISRAILAHLEVAGTSVRDVRVCDPDVVSARALVGEIEARGQRARVVGADEALEAGTVITATNVGVPHLDKPPAADQVYLNVSLRDFTPAALASAQNVVDDVDHCLRASTSPHLTEAALGHRRFISGTIPELIDGRLALARDRGVVVSPFGLGVLDLGVGRWVHRMAVQRGLHLRVPEFFGDLRRW